MSNVLDSPDPVVRSIGERHQRLASEAILLDTVLETYASLWYTPTVTNPPISALEHYSFLEGSECGCQTCAEWEQRRAEFIAAVKLVPPGHKWSICSCRICRFVGRVQLNFLAATNRRDLLIETSYHAAHHSQYGPLVMAWLEQELKKPKYTINWCAQEMSRYSLESWLRKCEVALGPVVSGVVFKTGMLINDLPVHFPSSLTVEVAWPSS